MDLQKHTGPDTVLFCQHGKSAPQPLISCTPDCPDTDDRIAAMKSAEIAKAVSSGSPIPAFEIVKGVTKKKTSK